MMMRGCNRLVHTFLSWRTCQMRHHLKPSMQTLVCSSQATWHSHLLNFSTTSIHHKKQKGGTVKSAKNVLVSKEEAAPVLNIDEYSRELQKVFDDLKEDYLHTLSLRTSTATFDRLPIKTKKDGTIPLNQIASIVQKTPTLLIINLSNSSEYMAAVVDALRTSGMNLNPQQEGLTIYIQIPKVSREQRESLAKSAKVLFNNAKTAMGKVHTSTLKKVMKQKKKGGGISVDLIHGVEAKILESMQSKVKEAETMMKAKQKELLDS